MGFAGTSIHGGHTHACTHLMKIHDTLWAAGSTATVAVIQNDGTRARESTMHHLTGQKQIRHNSAVKFNSYIC